MITLAASTLRAEALRDPRRLTVFELAEKAGVVLRGPDRYVDTKFMALLPIIHTLLEMRRAGLLIAVWIDNDELRVQLPGREQRQRMSWYSAEKICWQYRQSLKKPALAEQDERDRGKR